MSDFFEEYGWLLQSIIAGNLGLKILFDCILNENSSFAGFLIVVLKGLM